MTARKLVYASHRWLAAVTGAFTFLWFASAVAMLLPRDLLTLRSPPPAGAASPIREAPRNPSAAFKEISVSIPRAITAVESVAGGEAIPRSVRVEPFEGRLSYRIETEANGVWWVDTADARVTRIDSDVARRLVMAAGPAGDGLGAAEHLTKHGPGYSYGPIPAYRFMGERGLTFIVDPRTGEVQTWSMLRRWYRFVTGWHTLEFLRPYIGGPTVGLLMWILSLAGTGMTVFGLGILFLQLRQWRQGRHRPGATGRA